MEININVNKISVYDEVAKTTSYIGAKMGQEGAYQRIFTTDEDRTMLERFWVETAATATEMLKEYAVMVNQNESGAYDLENDYDVTLDMPSNYDNTQTSSINNSMYNFFVASILTKWFKIVNKEEAEALYKQLVSLAYDYINAHPEQPYRYRFTSRFSYINLVDVVEGVNYGDDDEAYFLSCMFDEDGYHILSLRNKGDRWIPKDWPKLKSYINGEKVYLKK